MASGHENDLKRKLERLADRVQRIESQLGLEPPEASSADADPGIPHTPDASAEAPPAHPPSSIEEPAAPAEHAPSPLSRKADVLRSMGRARTQPSPDEAPAPQQELKPATSPTRPTATPPAAPPRSATRPRRSVELAIGVNWFAWVGAIVLVLAGALFITTAYREGWIADISPVTRCIAVAGFGLALLGAGEWALRKVSRAAAVGFYGAGLGTLYLDAFATSQWFKIAPESTAFILLAVIALVGFALTLRARTLTIGVLSVIGGYLAPILLSDIAGSPAGAAGYLTMLLAVALGLSAFVATPMRPLRYVAFAAHGLLATLFAFDAVPGSWHVALVAFTFWWMMIVSESVYAALREQSARGNVVITMLGSAWYVLIGVAILNATPPAGFDWLGAYTFAVGALCGAMALQFGPGIDVLRQRPRTAMDKLALALILQAGALITVAIALQFDGMGRCVAWIAVGIASIELGRRLPSRGMDIFGLVTGGLGVCAAAVMSHFTPTGLDTAIAELPGIEVRGWTILALLTIAALITAGTRLRAAPHGAWAGLKVLIIVAALIGWMLVWSIEAWGMAVTWLWLVGATALVVFERFGRREMFFELGVAALALTAGRWLLVEAVGARLAPSWDATAVLPILNWQMALALAIAAAAGIASLVARHRPTGSVLLAAGGAATARTTTAIVVATLGFTAFMLFALSFEVDRIVSRIALAGPDHAWSLTQMRNLVLTALWASGSVAVHVFASSLHTRGGATGRAAGLIMRAAWIAMLLLTGKWMVVDTLLFGVMEPSAARFDLTPVANVQMVTALVITGGLVLMLSQMKRVLRDAAHGNGAHAALGPFERTIASLAPVLTGVFILWAFSFEAERFIGRLEEAGTAFNWPVDQVRMLALAMLWSVGGAVMAGFGTWRRAQQLVTSGALIATLAGAFWLTAGTLQWRFQAQPECTTLILNMQFIAGAVAAGAIALAAWLLRPLSAPQSTPRALIAGSGAVIALIALWLGSLEIDRAFIGATATLSPSQATARQMCLSVYWGLFAFGLIATGFRMPAATVRYAGIILFGLTLGKVFLIDLAQVESIYRVASFAAVGLLLVLTSVAYARLAPKLLARENRADSTRTT